MSLKTPVGIRDTPYMTVIEDRRPLQKAHFTRGHAHQALGGRVRYNGTLYCDMALYEWDSEASEWRLLWEGKRGDEVTYKAEPWRTA